MPELQIEDAGRRAPGWPGVIRLLAALTYFSTLAFFAAGGMAPAEDAAPNGAADSAEPGNAQSRPAADQAPPAEPAGGGDPVPPASLSDVEACVLGLINTEREASGMQPLMARGDLSDTADGHSARMASSGGLYHRGNLREGTFSQAESVGENVGAGYTCEEVHKAFMSSPPHAGNVMRPDFNFVGLGTAQDHNGMYFVTQVFVKAPVPMRLGPVDVVPAPPIPPPAAQPAPAPAAEAPAPAAPAPEPAPPPPAGSKVPPKTAAYLGDLQG